MMPAPEPMTQPQAVTNGPPEPRPIAYIGGPMNGKTRADYGQMEWTDARGHLYKRVQMSVANREIGCTCVRQIMAYWGLVWHQEV
jgi:hypothetical protein